jgi:cyclomaltodextrinase
LEDNGYRSFFGVLSMPQVNLNHPDARQWMLDITKYWLEEFEIDGYRLDFANGPNLDFWSDFWVLTKKINPDSFCFAEVVETPRVMEKYQGRMDGVLDFHVADAIRRTFGRKSWSEERFNSMLNQHESYFNKDFVRPSFLDNHDMDRFQFITGGSEENLRQAAQVQFQLPGPPIIYYGTEVGVQQTVSKSSEVGLEASRGAMLWGDEQNKSILSYYQELIKERKEQRPWEN